MAPNPKRFKMAPPSPSLKLEKPANGFLNEDQIKQGVLALKKYIKKKSLTSSKNEKPKDLLEAGEKQDKRSKLFVEVVFKVIPSNNKTYIHNVLLPHHWRKTLEPEELNVALFVPHKKPETDAEKIQFSRDRDLDLRNTHDYYKELFERKLSTTNRNKISRIITSKELATEYGTPQKLDKLVKTFDIFLADKKLMSNKFNALPRRLGRRFWVREKKVPLIVKLEAKDLDGCFDKVMNTEPFYLVGNSATEKLQIGLSDQKTKELVINIQAFLDKLYGIYSDNVRFIRLRTNEGLSVPLFADLAIA